MHVLFICGEYPPYVHGGVGSFDQTLARELVRIGHTASVVGLYSGIDRDVVEDDQGVHVVRLPISESSVSQLGSARAQRLLWRVVRGLDPDVIEGTELSLWSRPGGVSGPCVIRLHGGHHFFSHAAGRAPRRLRALTERRSFAKADAFVGVSQYVVDETRRYLRFHGKPTAVIPNAIDVDRFTAVDAEYEHDLVFFVGTLCLKKGVEELLDAFALVLRDHPDLRLVIAGRDSIDSRTGRSFREGLEAEMDPLVAARVEFLGAQPNAVVADYLARARLTVLPSHMETFGIVWAEAMVSGAALVASRTGPGPEVVQDGRTGLLADPFDPTSIAGAMRRLLDDAALSARLRSEAATWARSRYSISRLVHDNVDFWSGL